MGNPRAYKNLQKYHASRTPLVRLLEFLGTHGPVRAGLVRHNLKLSQETLDAAVKESAGRIERMPLSRKQLEEKRGRDPVLYRLVGDTRTEPWAGRRVAPKERVSYQAGETLRAMQEAALSALVTANRRALKAG